MNYIFDIDGTLADLSHRLHFIQKEPADWTGFFAACPGDKQIPEIATVAKSLSKSSYKIVMITGRSDEIRDETEEWLDRYNIPWDALYMRKAGDHREDSVVKAELLDTCLRNMPGTILGVFEDRQQVVDMYRAKGLRVFQVAEGKF